MSAKSSNRSRASSAQSASQQNTSSSSPLTTATPNENVQVYILDIPTNMSEDDLETLIHNRMKIFRLKIKQIKYYLKFGIVCLILFEAEHKSFLINEVVSIVLDPDNNINIKFHSDVELDSYIIIDRNILKAPSSEEVAQKYMESYQTADLYPCKIVSVQFSNIFRIYVPSLDELLKVANAPNFKFGTGFATVYTRFNCNFFEQVPANITEEKVLSAIASHIGEEKLNPASFYVQYDKETSNVIVLASKSNKKWTQQSFLTINGCNIPKKIKLAYRVVIYPIPCGFDIHDILNHPLFEGRTVSHAHINDNLIVELDDMKTYQGCLKTGALRFHNTVLEIRPHKVVNEPSSCELSGENWYQTDMHDIEPDITKIISDHRHPIFHYKWSARNWLEHFKIAEQSATPGGKYDLEKHLLRVTVMLNTIGTLRKKMYTVNDKEVKLNLQCLKTIVYDHESKLFNSKIIHLSELETPFPCTKVTVCNEDCLLLYEKLVKEGHRPLLLNMASATSPGGGYRKGDGAQEENLFRRSDYYQSLDLEIADKDRSERLHCSSKCEVRRPKRKTDCYPMDEFGAIYTSGITVFRGTEAEGYPYMIEPLYNVCSIAMAAYRDPKLTADNLLEKKFATNTRKKIENIFAIGYHQKHDCLVLSALGCGAFKNPPKHIALLFKSVIYQYAGYFKKIYFAIIDDHNAGKASNPKGNFLPFKEALDDLVVHPAKAIHVNGNSGPYRILNRSTDGKITLNDSCIHQLPPCHHGTDCRDHKDPQHNTKFSHPPICLYQEMNSMCDQMDDDVHRFTYFHRIKCRDGGECKINDSNHLNEFDHPDFCIDKSNCIDLSPEHLHAYRHLPFCPEGIDCPKLLKGISEHITSFRHCRTICPDASGCPKFHDKEHIRKFIHSFKEPCPFTPYNCSLFVQYTQAAGKRVSDKVESHCLSYAHVCQFGRFCTKEDSNHFETYVHIPRKLCSDLEKCSRLTDEYHLQSFSHPNIRDIRFLCKFPGFQCRNRTDDEHLRKFRHTKDFDQLGVAPSRDLNSSINFLQNQGYIIRKVNSYVESSHWGKARVPQDILTWIRALQPTHRCGPEIFASILVHGHVMSRDYMNELIKPTCIINAVMQHNKIRSIFLQHHTPAVKSHMNELIELLVTDELLKAGPTKVTLLDSEHANQVSIVERKLVPPLDETELQIIHDWTAKIVAASIHLNTHLTGIGYEVDKKLDTYKHVFSILGPHHGHYYGDIVITFKQEIMFHPDANFSIQAGTSFYSGRIYGFRPWWKDSGSEDDRINDFHKAKLHCSCPRYEYAAAVELIAATGKSKNTMNVSLEEIIKSWTGVDSHFVFEGHLPSLIPLDYIENIYMPENLFQSLPKESQELAKEIFKESMILKKHDVDLSLIKKGPVLPLDSSRQPYLGFIMEELNKKICERMKTPRISRGLVITIPGTAFGKHTVLPLTISQSYHLHCLNKGLPKSGMDETYIYWQVMDGDMMLTLANEKIKPDGKLPSNLQCLICYVAAKPSTTDDDYRECYSYLNVESPFQHENNVQTGNFKAKSNRFYRGCNTDDYFTFCLKIVYKTGEVSLTHAGPNGIYNHENIHYQFSSTDLNLLKLEYVHISAGEHDTPIRNLTINHERVDELHPEFDKTFKFKTPEFITKDRRLVQPTHYHNNRIGTEIRPSSASTNSRPHRERTPSDIDGPREVLPPLNGSTEQRTTKQSLASKLKSFLCRSNIATKPSISKQPVPLQRSKEDQSMSNAATAPSVPPRSPPLASSTLPPCRDSIYCLHQDDKDHVEKYSHLCRFNELCRNQSKEPHAIHKVLNNPRCRDDRDCSKLTDPVHRAEYRHSGLPDYLIPCRFQATCYSKKSDHRVKYFHGEEIPSIKKK